ncbi:asparagine synthase-related protein [Sphingomonas sp.]|uniref:asparagine synthase-related protein n=1 Tax=Sphingomonas sp. TaxID=28214 RepID=UPI0025DB2A4E|nr:asparagine synthase-related protein [Sphingomonas sp.]
MLAALSAFGSDGRVIAHADRAAFGRNLFKTLPEDDFDAQPTLWPQGRLFVADARIDNRADVARSLRIAAADAAILSDGALLAASWRRWKFDAVERVLGDYAFATWDGERECLTLVRSPFSLKPLFFCSEPRFAAFASMPAGLFALREFSKKINIHYAAGVAALYSYLGSATIFEGVEMVRHGHAVELARDATRSFPIWTLERKMSPIRRAEEAGEALRAEFDRATRCSLRRHKGSVASQLSSGRDSSAVTASAAIAMKDGRELLTALTGAPREGFSAADPPEMLSDESGMASKMAAIHPNLRHVICRPSSGSIIPTMEAINAVHHGPLLNPSNLPWWAAINDAASTQGNSVLLHGTTGNFTISAGGPDHIGDFLHEEGPLAWAQVLTTIGGGPPSRWIGALSQIVGPFLSRSAYDLILKASGRSSDDVCRVLVLREPYRTRAEALLREKFGDARPPLSAFEYRRDMLMLRDNPEKMSLGKWGLDPRDPTSDRAVVELCFSFRARHLFSSGAGRPAFDAAFGNRIPRESLCSTRRGYQGADWFEHFPLRQVAAAFMTYGKNELVRELLDYRYIEALLDAWPADGWDRRERLLTYRNSLIGALALASFIDFHFPD